MGMKYITCFVALYITFTSVVILMSCASTPEMNVDFKELYKPKTIDAEQIIKIKQYLILKKPVSSETYDYSDDCIVVSLKIQGNTILLDFDPKTDLKILWSSCYYEIIPKNLFSYGDLYLLGPKSIKFVDPDGELLKKYKKSFETYLEKQVKKGLVIEKTAQLDKQETEIISEVMKSLKNVKGNHTLFDADLNKIYVLNDCFFGDKIEIPKGCKISCELGPFPPVETRIDRTYELSLYQKHTFEQFYESQRKWPKGYVLNEEIMDIVREFFPNKPEKYLGKTFRINFPVKINDIVRSYHFDFNLM